MPHTTANSISLMNMLFLHVGYVYGYSERSHFIVFFLSVTAHRMFGINVNDML